MNVLNTSTKPAATLAIGQFSAREYRYYCPRCGFTVGSEELRGLVAQRCKIGYDVLAYVGQEFFLNSRDNEQIVMSLREKNIIVCRSEISYLAKKFIVHLALLHKKVQRETRSFLSLNGGYILHLDGTCEGESPHLISVLDGITEIVLDNTKVPTENAEDLIPFLQGIKAAYGDPVALVSDMGKGILAAAGKVFEHVPSFICHYHFLKSVGKELFGTENDIIRKRLRAHGIKGTLKRRFRTLDANIAAAPSGLEEAYLTSIETKDPMPASTLAGYEQMVLRTLIDWVLKSKNQGQGHGFPFDQTYLVFYQRAVRIHTILGRLSQAGLFKGKKEKRLYDTIRRDLQPVMRDSVLKRAAATMQEKVDIFGRLRAAMRISLPENKHGLNDNGELCDMKTIEKEVTKFMRRLSKDRERMQDKAYQKMLGQITKYWDKLFCDPIVVETKAGKITIQPQRTNNLLEQFFRTLMRKYRKKNGFQAMARVLQAMLKDTPLIMNLRNEDFMDILLCGKKDLAQRFADVDVEEVRKRMGKSTESEFSASAKLKRVISSPTFPESLMFLIGKKAS
jgi:hypothetical protein|tara:strand:+ start:1022 stop:2713 length:1692 start_codon:yes stop_codon:yes gene_type:complete